MSSLPLHYLSITSVNQGGKSSAVVGRIESLVVGRMDARGRGWKVIGLLEIGDQRHMKKFIFCLLAFFGVSFC